MRKAVLKLNLNDNKEQKKAMKIVSKIGGVDSIDINLKDQKLTVTGAMDPVEVTGKLRKVFNAELILVGPAKEAQKKDGDKKGGDKSNKDSKTDLAKVVPTPYVYYPPHLYYHGSNFSAEEDPNGCVIS
ncbi:hypothetical protein BT93_A2143 [Corymbia citriodora subsp. variegata]|nr:hypothetical protein BT93_A2143 [Corymbia citriodora subsp. variegata]